MSHLSLPMIRAYLSKSIASFNENKLHGIRAEADFRSYVGSLIGDNISPGGWIFRPKGVGLFGKNAVAVFPHLIVLARDYSASPTATDIPSSLYGISSALHQIGITSFYAHPVLKAGAPLEALEWQFAQLGTSATPSFWTFDEAFKGFVARSRRYNYLRYSSDVSAIPDLHAVERFSHENLRVFVDDRVMSETSDIDGVIWGKQNIYPVEIKEKAAAKDNDMGEWFGLDLGPFVKLAHYAAARKGNMHSLFVVREIESTDGRKFKNWLFVEFDDLAQRASWVPRRGGASMGGGQSSVVRIPRDAFNLLDASAISKL